ncbi:MAG TPA: RibD family protein, partial [Rhodanobacteraceae bacterium]|nr:RibD family protein [Rhodanobacteraceae bacterium]
SLDGRTALASGASKWITSAASREDVQRWRARSSAILTASGTAGADDPRLTVRLDGDICKPLRVVLDARLEVPAGANLLDGTAPTLVLHAPDARPDTRHANVETAAVEIRDGRLDLQAVLALLAARGVNELQVEAGPRLCGALFAAGLVDELLLYVAPSLFGDDARPLLALPPLASMDVRPQFRVIDSRRIGDDMRLLLRPLPKQA